MQLDNIKIISTNNNLPLNSNPNRVERFYAANINEHETAPNLTYDNCSFQGSKIPLKKLNLCDYLKLKTNSLIEKIKIKYNSLMGVDRNLPKTSTETYTIHLKDSYSLEEYKNTVELDLSKPCEFELRTVYFNRSHPIVTCEYNPRWKGVVYNRETHEPIKVNILRMQQDNNETCYFFMTEDMKENIGFVLLEDCINEEVFKTSTEKLNQSTWTKDYPEVDIIGPRIFVNYLENYDEKNMPV